MSATSSKPGRTRRLLAGAGAACLTASLLPLTTGLASAAPVPITTTNEPPAGGTEVVVFPQRDFVAASGFAEGDTVTVEVEHSATYGGGVISSTSGLVPKDDPATPEFDGLVEVNHPGEYGWGAVTPDIRPGDKVRVVRDSGPQVGVAEQTTVANVTAKRPVQTAPDAVVVRGSAVAADGGRIPLDQLEVRLTSPGNLFQLGGKRSIRTGVTRGATIAYDDAGSTAFTATFSTLGAADVTRALEAETGALWLGTDPAAGAESTIYEVGADVVPGPQGPGNGPLEQLPPPPGSELEPPSTPEGATATLSGNNAIVLEWGAATDNVGVTSYGVYRDGVAIANVQRPDGAAPAPTTYIDKNLPQGDFAYSIDAADEVGNRSTQSAVTPQVATKVNPAADVPVNVPPANGIAIVVFPSRDFTEVEGIPEGSNATVELIRNGRVVSSSENLIPTGGVVEVNHPGGGCWEGVTPEVRAGDQVRATILDTATGLPTSVHQITVANVSAKKAVKVTDDDPATPAFEGSVKITGFAQGHDGSPLPLGEIEARLIASSKEPFGKNGRRTLRAPEDGTLEYDTTDNPLGNRFTATFSGLDAADVTRALEVESRIMWLGRDPLAGVELTIYEAGSGDAPGPAAGFCTSPIEAPDAVAPSAPVLTATPDGPNRTVTLSWTEAQDESYVYGYRISRDGTPVANVAADARSFTDTAVGPGEHTYAVQAFDSASALGAGADPAERLANGQGGEYGNFSTASAGRTVTMPDVTAPTVPANLQVTNPTTSTTNPDGTTTVTATRNARVVFDPSTDDSGAAGIKHRVYRDGVLLPAAVPTLAANGKLVHLDRNLTSGATYRYAVDAVDAAGNASARTTEVPVVIAADTTAPAAVQNVKAVVPDARARDITVSWDATTDTTDAAGSPGLVTAYRVFRNGTLAGTVSGTELTFTDTGLAAGTHTYKVSAVDSGNNVSDRASQVAAGETVANDPPAGGRSITVFPARDIVEGGGYTAADGPVRAQVLRKVDGAWKVVSTSTPAMPNAEGIVEVNHAGPDCWTTNTPDIRPGDIARIITAKGATADQTVVQDLTVQRPSQVATGTIEVRGTAKSVAGLPVDAGRLEHRIVSDGANFTRNGRNAILTPADGTLVLAADGSWTATYTGLSAADVTRALNGESVVNWLGRDALAGNELTIQENYPGSDGGPAGGGVCTSPLEPGVAQASLSPSTRDVFADTTTGATSAARTVRLTNSGGAPLTVTAVYLAGLNPGDFSVAHGTLPATLAPGQSLPVSVSFTPTAVGARAATVGFVDNAANTSYQSVSLTGNGVVPGAPATPGVPTRALAFDTPMTGGTTAKVNLSWTASAGAVTYEVQRSVAGGAFTRVATVDAVAGAAKVGTQVDVTPGSAHRFQVRAVNSGGASAYATGATFTLAPLQENNAAVTYRGTWPRTALAGSFGGSVTSNAAAGNTATLRTNGTGFAVVSSKGPDRGMVEVWLNGARRATVNLYSPTVQPAHVIFATDGLANTTHSVEVRPTGARPTGSTGSRVDVDGFLAVR